jgi:glycosyltransferase involved in cell wall biosynthesis
MTYKSQTVSAIVITENNADTLERALSSLHWVDEIVVVDRGSTDQTLAIARGFTDNVHFHPGKSYNIVKRDALSLGKSDWMLYIEPDEWVEEMLRHEIDGIMLNMPAHLNGFTIPRHLKFQNQMIKTLVGEDQARCLRLVRKGQWEVGNDWSAKLKAGGDVGKLDRPIGYAPYKTVESLFADINRHSTVAAYRQLEAHGTNAGNVSPFSMLWQTKMAAYHQFFLKGGLFKGLVGVTIAMANTMNVFLKLAKMRSLTQKHP